MANVEMLKSIIDDKGVKITVLAQKAGLTRASMYNKMRHKTDFKASEAEAISNFLGLTQKERTDIFLAKS